MLSSSHDGVAQASLYHTIESLWLLRDGHVPTTMESFFRASFSFQEATNPEHMKEGGAARTSESRWRNPFSWKSRGQSVQESVKFMQVLMGILGQFGKQKNENKMMLGTMELTVLSVSRWFNLVNKRQKEK